MILLRHLERVLAVGGIGALLIFGMNYGRAHVAAAEDVALFNAAMAGQAEPDTSLWSSHRVAAFRSHEPEELALIGALRIKSAAIVAPIYAGTTANALDYGVGWIEGTVRPGGDGNVGLAAHRDGFFRGLKDVQVGDTITTVTRNGESDYEITALEVVSPGDTHVLAPSGEAKLTLVTCYPFYFVGAAPKRFIVHARLVSRHLPDDPDLSETVAQRSL